MGLGIWQKSFGPRLQDGAATEFDILLPAGQPGKEIVDLFLHPGLGPQVQVPGRLLPHPAPDGLIGVEVRTVTRQSLPP